MIGIEREQTAQEKGDYRRLGIVTPKDKFLKVLAETESQFTRKHRPFDMACARGDFIEELEQIERESERRYGFIEPNFVNSIKLPDLSKYSDEKRFEILREDEEVEIIVINGVKSSVKTGYSVTFVCKERGHKMTVFMDNDVYNEWKGIKKSKTDKED